MNSSEIRDKFLRFFESKGHTIVRSSSLIPGNDPTLLFTNSGMVQFKDVFLGHDKRPYTRATTAQRSLRAGGKHNDLENVGYTARHHTFFEMLGNFSFGDYFKRDAIHYAWELLTQIYQLPPEKLWVTVYAEDDEAYNIWANDIKVPTDRIIRIGDNKGARYASDNFWQMADTGPCGPCSEIFYDHGEEIAGGPPGSPDEDGDRYIEIWNLVFMQFNKDEAGTLHPLPSPCVDTGMGLERITAVLQHVHSNYEIDSFATLIKAAARETKYHDLQHNSLKVIADHIRASAFLIVDGVIPGNEGRGYVLRRIVRRALRHGHKLGQTKPFFYQIVQDLVSVMGEAYPELKKAQNQVELVLKQEEERFGETLEHGMKLLEAALSQDSKNLAGEMAFTLYDTYGFPIDLTADICRERNVSLDTLGFEAAMERQKTIARAAGKFKQTHQINYQGDKTEFVGYNELTQNSKITALYVEGQSVQHITAGQNAIVVLDTTPFYAESGGQVGDCGTLEANHAALFEVGDTQKIIPDVFGHHGQLKQGELKVGDVICAKVDPIMRVRSMRNHSATHLMHKALRQVLGEHVSQKGSLVDPEKTRFDFSHHKALTADEIAKVEDIVNQEILFNAATQAQLMSYDDAIRHGAMALFGEKYGDKVRVLDIGSSRELCGGTHVTRTGDIGSFRITSEGGVAAGIRRIEAVTGENALAHARRNSQQIAEIAHVLKTNALELPQRIIQIQEHIKTLEKEINVLKSKLAQDQGKNLIEQTIHIEGVSILSTALENTNPAGLREILDNLKNQLKTAVIVLACVNEGKVSLIAGVTNDTTHKVKAGELVNFVAQQVDGKGGGRPDMAQAGGTDPSQLASALASVIPWVNQRIKA
jgi:alanyl-tRNA synthetase